MSRSWRRTLGPHLHDNGNDRSLDCLTAIEGTVVEIVEVSHWSACRRGLTAPSVLMWLSRSSSATVRLASAQSDSVATRARLTARSLRERATVVVARLFIADSS